MILLAILCVGVFLYDHSPVHPHIVSYLFERMGYKHLIGLGMPVVYSFILAWFCSSRDGRQYMATHRLPYIAYALLILLTISIIDFDVCRVLDHFTLFEDYRDYVAAHYPFR